VKLYDVQRETRPQGSRSPPGYQAGQPPPDLQAGNPGQFGLQSCQPGGQPRIRHWGPAVLVAAAFLLLTWIPGKSFKADG